MNRREAPPVDGVPIASRSPAIGVEPSAVIDRLTPPPFQCFPDAGAPRAGAHPIQGSARP